MKIWPICQWFNRIAGLKIKIYAGQSLCLLHYTEFVSELMGEGAFYFQKPSSV